MRTLRTRTLLGFLATLLVVYGQPASATPNSLPSWVIAPPRGSGVGNADCALLNCAAGDSSAQAVALTRALAELSSFIDSYVERSVTEMKGGVAEQARTVTKKRGTSTFVCGIYVTSESNFIEVPLKDLVRQNLPSPISAEQLDSLASIYREARAEDVEGGNQPPTSATTRTRSTQTSNPPQAKAGEHDRRWPDLPTHNLVHQSRLNACTVVSTFLATQATLETSGGDRIKIEENSSDILLCGPGSAGRDDSSSQQIAIYEQGLQARDFVKAVRKACEVKFETIEDTTFALVVGPDEP